MGYDPERREEPDREPNHQTGEISFVGEDDRERFESSEPCFATAQGGLLSEEPIANGVCGETILWSLNNDGLLSISGEGEMDNNIFSNNTVHLNNIPWYDYREQIREIQFHGSVTSIESYAFYNCPNLERVTIPSSVTRIGENAFGEVWGACEKLNTIIVEDGNEHYCSVDGVLYTKDRTSLLKCPAAREGDFVIPTGVKSVESYAFARCMLSSVTISDGVRTIGAYAFSDSYSLKRASVPESVEAIGTSAFRDCYELADVILSDGITDIGQRAFENCYELADENGFVIFANILFDYCGSAAELTIPDGITDIGDGAFWECKSITWVTIPNGVTRIGVGAFDSCSSLTSAELPDSVTWIGREAFFNCENLLSITIPNGVTRIEEYAFYDCSKLSSVSIPDGLCYIGYHAFYGTPWWSEQLGGLQNGFLYMGRVLVAYKGSEEEIQIPDGVTSLYDNAFQNNWRLKHVSLPDSLLTIGSRAFYGCTSLEDIRVGNAIAEIGNNAFYNCRSLRSFAFPESLTQIGEGSFYGCRSLEEIHLPLSVTVLENGVFGDCVKLKSLQMPGVVRAGDYAFQGFIMDTFDIPAALEDISGLAFFNAQIKNYAVDAGNRVYSSCDGILYSEKGKLLFLYPSAREGESFAVPDGVTAIGESAFAKVKQLKQINLNQVLYLGSSAFQESGLISVTLPDSVLNAGDFTFYDCNSLREVRFGDGLRETSYEMFEECDNLRTIWFSSALESLGARSFANCKSLERVELSDTIVSVGNACFGSCKSLSSFSGGALSVIPYQCFAFDTKLSQVNLNEGVYLINRCAFKGCVALLEIVLPTSMEHVWSRAFEDNTAVRNLNPLLEPYGENGFRLLEHVQISGVQDYGEAYQVLELVNQERTKKGLEPLTMDAQLLEKSMLRAAELSLLFSHTRPNGAAFADLDLFSSMYLGENAAAGQENAEQVMQSWMGSPGHRGNILTDYYRSIGIGCFMINGSSYWIQTFSATDAEEPVVRTDQETFTQIVDLAAEPFMEAFTSDSISYSFEERKSYEYSLSVFSEVKSLHVGEQANLFASILNPEFQADTPIDPDSLLWTTSNESVLRVNNGVATAIGSGTAELTVSTTHARYTASVSITVVHPELDVNEDDKVDASDGIDLILGLFFQAIDRDNNRLDVNGNGTVDLNDAVSLLYDKLFPDNLEYFIVAVYDGNASMTDLVMIYKLQPLTSDELELLRDAHEARFFLIDENLKPITESITRNLPIN